MSQKTILIVDDEKDIVEVVKKRIEFAGYNVKCAYDGKEALFMIEQEAPDLIVLDIMMPELNGSTLCGMLKFDGRFKDIPIVILSVMSRDLDKMIGEEVKADAYLTKPFEAKELIDVIKKLLSD